MTDIDMTIPLGGDSITPAAAAAMVGQTVRLNVQGRWDDPLGRGIVAAAEPTDDGLRVVLDVPVSVYERVVGRFEVAAAGRFKVPDDLSYGLGFRIDAAEATDAPGDEPHRLFTAVTPYEVSVHPPLTPRAGPSGLPGRGPS